MPSHGALPKMPAPSMAASETESPSSHAVRSRSPWGGAFNSRMVCRGWAVPDSHRRTVTMICVLCTSSPATQERKTSSQSFVVEMVRHGSQSHDNALCHEYFAS